MTKPNSKQLIAAAHIAQGRTKKEAAEAADVTPQTISTWMTQKPFTDAIQNLRSELIHSTRDSIRGLGRKAARTLSDLMDSGGDAVRLGATKYVLDTINMTPGTNGHEMGLWAPIVTEEESTLRPYLDDTENNTGE
ncbi:MAG: hypothetical protein WBM81_00500 [Sedimenticolaceae bacterium]